MCLKTHDSFNKQGSHSIDTKMLSALYVRYSSVIHIEKCSIWGQEIRIVCIPTLCYFCFVLAPTSIKLILVSVLCKIWNRFD